ncbi:hypothetical protein SAMN06295905_3643 [Devosia lucknowensis]|uniref:DUF1178 family protein n=1 Tax=Devosia lucknowensis TaxID=1096929 RepID=A0A1Y6GE38_9HYPH|nr:DUF1178 family protein [Devosia lucknowensis]SMQ86339.1 hypothetical protein SAMN06295905_3643 [Devosia lucknowensis]
MIQYSLQCSNGHRYEAWFKSASAYDEQQARGIVTCAQCGDAHVEKAPMAPNVARTDRDRVPLSAAHPDAAKMRDMLRLYRQKVISEAENVGDRFADEARKIHFDEAEARGIYGQATHDEVAGLIEDGVAFLPLPDVSDDN